MYRATQKGWDCKDDFKLYKYHDPKIKKSLGYNLFKA